MTPLAIGWMVGIFVALVVVFLVGTCIEWMVKYDALRRKYNRLERDLMAAQADADQWHEVAEGIARERKGA